MVKRKKYFLNPISCQNFANAFAETPNLNLEVRPRQKNTTFPKVAQNNARFFLLPSTAILLYYYEKKSTKKLKN